LRDVDHRAAGSDEHDEDGALLQVSGDGPGGEARGADGRGLEPFLRAIRVVGGHARVPHVRPEAVVDPPAGRRQTARAPAIRQDCADEGEDVEDDKSGERRTIGGDGHPGGARQPQPPPPHLCTLAYPARTTSGSATRRHVEIQWRTRAHATTERRRPARRRGHEARRSYEKDDSRPLAAHPTCRLDGTTIFEDAP
jgi:hypothetical protein